MNSSFQLQSLLCLLAFLQLWKILLLCTSCGFVFSDSNSFLQIYVVHFKNKIYWSSYKMLSNKTLTTKCRWEYAIIACFSFLFFIQLFKEGFFSFIRKQWSFEEILKLLFSLAPHGLEYTKKITELQCYCCPSTHQCSRKEMTMKSKRLTDIA